MGGAGPNNVALPAGGNAAAVAEAAWGPFRCHRRRCTVNMAIADPVWVNKHLAGHDYEEDQERKALKLRNEQRAAQKRAAGPSKARREQKKLDMAAFQRKQAAGKGAPGKKHKRGGA